MLNARERHHLAVQMAIAYVAGEDGNNYQHWRAMKANCPAISDKVIRRMKFVIDRMLSSMKAREQLLELILERSRKANVKGTRSSGRHR